MEVATMFIAGSITTIAVQAIVNKISNVVGGVGEPPPPPPPPPPPLKKKITKRMMVPKLDDKGLMFDDYNAIDREVVIDRKNVLPEKK